MSEIDRIAEDLTEWIASHFDGLSDAATETKVRAALLEYGQIVREECAKACDDEVAKIRRYDSEGRMKSERGALVTVAAAIRNANKG